MHLHFRKYGSGPDLVILHGLYGSSDNWITIARKLQDHYTVWLPDLRNHGASPHLPSHTYREMTEDLHCWMNHHGIEEVYLIGHSMGGKVAMRFAAENPERVNRLMIIDIAPKNYLTGNIKFKHIRQHEMILELLEDPDLSKFSSRKELDDFFSSKIKEESVRLFLLKNIHRSHGGFFEWKLNAAVLREAFQSIVSETDSSWFEERAPITAYPVTFIRGLNSDYVSEEDWKEIKKIYPEATLINFEGAGHWLHAEQPSRLVACVLEKA